MVRKMWIATMTAALVSGAAVWAQETRPAPQGKQADNPEYARWAEFKPGASATYQETASTAGIKTDREVTLTLVEKMAEQAVVEMKIIETVGGNRNYRPPERITIPARIPAGQAQTQPAETGGLVDKATAEEKAETVEVNGGKLSCQVQKTTVQIGQSKVVTTVATSSAVPGGLVKLQTEVEGSAKSTTKMTLVEFKLVAAPSTSQKAE